MVCAAHAYRSPLVVINGNLNAQRNCGDTLAHHVIITIFNMIMSHLVQVGRDIVNFLIKLTLITLMTGPLKVNIDYINDWSAKSNID